MKQRFLALFLVLILVSSYSFGIAEADSWICPECGTDNSMNFCLQCGTKKPERLVCKECGQTFSLDSGVVFCGNCGARMLPETKVPGRYEGPGFDTPEAALTCYMEGLKNLDFEQMLSAFAWETQIEHFDFNAFWAGSAYTKLNTAPRMPSLNAFLISANVNMIRSLQTRHIYDALETYLLGVDTFSFDTKIPIKTEEEINAFLRNFDGERLENLSQMKNIRILSAAEVLGEEYNKEDFRKSIAKFHDKFGADEYSLLYGIADVGDETLLCGPAICRYGDRWYLVTVGGTHLYLLGVSADLSAFVCGKTILEDYMGKYLK